MLTASGRPSRELELLSSVSGVLLLVRECLVYNLTWGFGATIDGATFRVRTGA